MNIEQLYFGSDPKYPYKFRIEIPDTNITPMAVVKKWATDNNFRCCLVPGAVYVRDKKDAVLFVLKWL